MPFKSRDHYFLPTLAICFGILALMLFEPLSYDNAIYQQMAREIIQYHRLPYVATWDQNFPGIIYLHYLAIAIFGVRDLGVRAFDLILQLTFCIVLYKLLRLWLREHVAAVATTLYAAFYVAGGGYMYFERDPYAAMCCVAAFYLLARPFRYPSSRIAGFFFSGLLAGYSMLLKPTAALFLLPIVAYIWIRPVQQTSLARVLQLLLYGLLGVLPLGIFLLSYSVIPGGISALCLATIRYNLDIYAGGRSGIHDILLNLLRTALFFPFATYGALLMRNTKSGRYFNMPVPKIPQWLYYMALIVTLASVVIQGKFWRYQWMPFCIAVLPLAAIGIEAVAEHALTPVRRHYALLGCIALASLIQMNPKSQVSVLYALTHREPIYGDTYDFASTNPDFGVKPERATIKYLNSQGVKDRDVEIASFEPHLRLDFPHEALEAFQYLYPISTHPLEPGGENRTFPLTSYQRSWQRSYFDTLLQTPPRFFVISLSSVWRGADSTLSLIPGFDTFFAAHYVHDTAFGSYQIYRRR